MIRSPIGTIVEERIKLVTTDGDKIFNSGISPNTTVETTTNIEAIANIINTSPLKIKGKMIFNSTTNKPLWASGNANNSTWLDATGSIAHTPS